MKLEFNLFTILLIIFGFLIILTQHQQSTLNLNGSYKVYNNKNVVSTWKNSFIIRVINSKNDLECLSQCNINSLCHMIIRENSNCCQMINNILLNKNYLLDMTESKVFIKKNSIEKMTPNYYWSFDNNFNDIVGESNMFGNHNVTFVNDRFNNSLSALYFGAGSRL